MPLVSIIIPAWNAAAFIRYPIQSCLRQSIADLEVLVVDDASTDSTVQAALEAGAGDARLRVLRMDRNGGPSRARNHAIDQARGEFIAVLDADDRMAPERLERLLAVARTHQCDIVFDNLMRCPAPDHEQGGEPHLPLDAQAPARRLGLAEFAKGNRMGASDRALGYLQPLFRSSFLEAHALRYDETLHIGEDYQLVAEALARGARLWLHPEALYYYWQREGSLSKRPKVAHLGALIDVDAEFQARHGARFSQEERAAVRLRRRSLERLKVYLHTRELALQGRYISASRALLHDPAAVANLGPWLRQASRRVFGGG